MNLVIECTFFFFVETTIRIHELEAPSRDVASIEMYLFEALMI